MLSLPSAASSSLSGMRAAQVALDASAHNIANLVTPGFRRAQVQQSTTLGAGVSVAVSQSAAPRHALESDVVDQLVASNGFLANLAVFKAGDQMLGALLDVRR